LRILPSELAEARVALAETRLLSSIHGDALEPCDSADAAIVSLSRALADAASAPLLDAAAPLHPDAALRWAAAAEAALSSARAALSVAVPAAESFHSIAASLSVPATPPALLRALDAVEASVSREFVAPQREERSTPLLDAAGQRFELLRHLVDSPGLTAAASAALRELSSLASEKSLLLSPAMMAGLAALASGLDSCATRLAELVGEAAAIHGGLLALALRGGALLHSLWRDGFCLDEDEMEGTLEDEERGGAEAGLGEGQGTHDMSRAIEEELEALGEKPLHPQEAVEEDEARVEAPEEGLEVDDLDGGLHDVDLEALEQEEDEDGGEEGETEDVPPLDKELGSVDDMNEERQDAKRGDNEEEEEEERLELSAVEENPEEGGVERARFQETLALDDEQEADPERKGASQLADEEVEASAEAEEDQEDEAKVEEPQLQPVVPRAGPEDDPMDLDTPQLDDEEEVLLPEEEKEEELAPGPDEEIDVAAPRAAEEPPPPDDSGLFLTISLSFTSAATRACRRTCRW
jgi:hypothetical protein